MKTFIPQNIEWWIFDSKLNMWWLSISIIQLFILAGWVWIWLWIWNSISKSTWDKFIATIIAAPILILALALAFFKKSELWLIAYIAKIIKNVFIETDRAYQVNYKRIDPTEVHTQFVKTAKIEQKLEEKMLNIDKEKLSKLEQII